MTLSDGHFCLSFIYNTPHVIWFFSNQQVNVATKEVKSWQAENCYPSEPVFIPNPNAQDEDDGVVLSAVIGIKGQRSFLLVLDAKDMKEIARGYVPVQLKPMIHGEFL